MLSMKFASIGDIPPSTFKTAEFSEEIAWLESFTRSANKFQCGSISKSQWDLLFGSFQIITASTISCLLEILWVNEIFQRVSTLANVDLFFRMLDNSEAGAPQHSLDTCAIRYP